MGKGSLLFPPAIVAASVSTKKTPSVPEKKWVFRVEEVENGFVVSMLDNANGEQITRTASDIQDVGDQVVAAVISSRIK